MHFSCTYDYDLFWDLWPQIAHDHLLGAAPGIPFPQSRGSGLWGISPPMWWGCEPQGHLGVLVMEHSISSASPQEEARTDRIIHPGPNPTCVKLKGFQSLPTAQLSFMPPFRRVNLAWHIFLQNTAVNLHAYSAVCPFLKDDRGSALGGAPDFKRRKVRFLELNQGEMAQGSKVRFLASI